MADDTDPPERDVKDYKFQQLCKVRVTDLPDNVPLDRASAIEVSSKYGLTFVAVPLGFKVLRTKDFIDRDSQHSADRLKHIITDFPVLAEVSLGLNVTHLSLSCDDLTLAVATLSDHVLLHMFDVRNFAGQVAGSVFPFFKVNVAGSGESLLDLAWNPVSPKLLVTCVSSGRLNMYEISETLGVKAAADNAKARCVCWSPKGKQLVVGREDGLLVQYDPDLNIKRKWDYPAVFPDQSYQAVDIIWLSTYTFMVAYISSGADCSDQPSLLLINGSKDNATTFVNFEDVCFGRGEERLRKYFLHYIQQWDILLSGSSNSAEIAVVGKHLDQKDTWERWNLDDSARAECPLTDNYEDTFPMGVAVDLSSQTPIPLGDDKVHPPIPLMLVLSTEGLIIPYYMMYMHKDAPAITEPARLMDTTGIRKSAAGTPGIGSALGAKPPSAVKNLFGSSTQASQPAAAAAPFSSLAKPGIGAPTDQSTPKPLFGAGLTSASDQSASNSLFSAGQTASSTQSVTKSLFGAGQSTATTDQSAPKSIFGSTGGQSALASALNSTDPNATKPSQGFGQPSFGFAATVPQSGAGSGFSLSSSPAFPASSGAMAAGTTPNLTFGQDTSTAPSFSFLPKSSAQTTTDAVPTGSSVIGSLLTKPGDTATSQPSGFAFKVGVPASTAQTAKPPPAYTSTTAPPAFGSFSASAQSQATGLATFGAKPAPPYSAPSVLGAGSMTSGFGTTASSGSLGGGATLGLAKTQASAAGFGFGTSTAPASVATATVKPVAIGTTTTGAAPAKPPSIQAPASLPGTMHKSSTAASGLAGFAQTTGGATAGFVPASTGPSRPAAASSGEPESSESSKSADLSYNKSIMDEIKHFELEMSQLKSRAAQADYSIGGREEMSKLKKQTEDIQMFTSEMKSTMKELNKDVQDQTAFCLDMFAAVEESRMREQMMTDPKYHHLLKSRPLDPGSAERLQLLQQQYQVLDQGVRDVDLILDTQWEEYQNNKKNKSNRLQAPTNDAVYRAVKSNHNIIVAQKAKLTQLEQRLKQLKLHNQTVTWNSTAYSGGDKTELSTLADSLVSTSPVKSVDKSQDSGSSSLTANKLSRLRDHLYRRHVPVIKSTRPENLSMSKIAVEDRQILKSPEKPKSAPTNAQFSDAGSVTQIQSRPGDMMRRSSPRAPKAGTAFPASSSGQTGSQLPSVQNFGQQGMQSTGMTGSQFGLTGAAGKTGFELAAKPKTSAAGTLPAFGSGFGVGQPFSYTSGTDKPPTFQPHQQMIVTKVSEVNGIKLEDITPSGSEHDVEETEEDEYDDEEEDDSSGSGAAQGFGLQYNMPPAGSLTSTPLSTKAATPASKPADIVPPTDTGSLPVGRKLFGTSTAGPTAGQTAGEPFQFGTASTTPGFMFGGTGITTGKPEDKTSTAQGTGLSLGQATSTAPSLSSTSSTASPFAFGQSTGLASSGQFTFGGAGAGPASSGQSAGLQFGQAKTTAPTFTGIPGTSVAPNPVATVASSTTGPGIAPPVIARSTRDEAPATGSQSSAVSTGQDTSRPNSIFTQLLSDTQESDGESPGTTATTAGTSAPTPVTVAASTPAAGFSFGSSSAATSSTSLFGTQTSTNSAPSPFGSTSNGTSLFGSSTSTSGSTSLFGSSAAASTTSTGLFGSGSVSSTTPSFGALVSASTATTTVSSTTPATGLFGSTPSSAASTTATTAASTASTVLFGSSTTTASTGIFGSSSATTTTAAASSGGLFGTSTTASSTTTSGGLFGSSTTAATTASTGLFGSSSTTSSAGTGLFGSTPSSATPTGTSLFGQSTSGSETTTAPSTGLFGQPSSTAEGSGGLFGQGTSTSSTGGTSLFGQPSSSSSGGLFGNQTATSGSGTGLFGSTAATTSSTSLFGQPSSSGSGGLFGSGGSGFGTATSGSGSGFGSPASSSSGFGATTSGTGFGFGQTSSPGFAKPAFGQTSGFGQSPSSGGLFGSSGGEGGGAFGGLGGKPSEEKANTNVFGSSQTFGSGSTAPSGLFGSSQTQSSFGGGQTSSAGPFSGAGAFSGGGQGVGSTGFSALNQQSQGGGFGGSPSFGSPPAFGGAPGFGSAPKFGSSPGFGAGSTGFGSAPAFGSGATFGSPSTSGAPAGGFGGFGAAATGSPTFGALAQSTDAPTFGSLAGGGEGGGFGAIAGGSGAGGFGAMAGGSGGGGFGSPSFGAQPQQPQAFGGSSFGGSPSFSGYRG